MNYKIFSFAILSIFLLSMASAVVVYADFSDGTQAKTIALGNSVVFNADFFSMNPPMTMKVQIIPSQGSTITLLDTNANSKTYYDSYLFTPAQAGTYEIRAIGTDSVNTDSEFLILTVSSTGNNAPIITSSPITSVSEGQNYFYDVQATDSDGPNSLVYSFIQNPGWLSINSATGAISGVAPFVNSDTNYNVEVRVFDGLNSVSQPYTLTVLNGASGNIAPDITSSPVTSITEGNNYYYDVDATDSNGDFLTYGLIQAPGWLSINMNTGEITGTAPLVSSSTDYTVEVEVSDGNGGTDTQIYTLRVKNYSSGSSGGGSRTISEPDIYYPNKYFDQFNSDVTIYSKPTGNYSWVWVLLYILIGLISLGILIVVFLLGKNLRR